VHSRNGGGKLPGLVESGGTEGAQIVLSGFQFTSIAGSMVFMEASQHVCL
jgi:hypothetical protein